jgi:hypothetical protein
MQHLDDLAVDESEIAEVAWQWIIGSFTVHALDVRSSCRSSKYGMAFLADCIGGDRRIEA